MAQVGPKYPLGQMQLTAHGWLSTHVAPFWQYVKLVWQKLILNSQREPVKPQGHVHLKPLIPSGLQTPPFIHGFEAQKLTIVWQFTPVRPGGQWPFFRIKFKI